MKRAMMKKPTRVVLLVLLVLLISMLVTGAVLALAGPSLSHQVLSGGASEATAGKISLRATLGEPIIGLTGSKGLALGQGFWYGGELPEEEEDSSSIFLPLLSRED